MRSVFVRVGNELRGRWGALSLRTRIHGVLLVVVTGAAVGHQAAFWHWFIEDAAISFAYARHWVEGEGLVAFPGGERIEGYSNPLWVALLAVVHGMGFDLFKAVPPVQAVLTGLTVPATYLAAREASDADSDVPIVAAALLAAHSPFALWGSSGLENGLMNLLLALALWRMWVELRTGGWPVSPWLWLGVTLCRPEAILYAAGGGLITMIGHLAAGRGLKPTVWWLLQFFSVWCAYQAARYAYFAWPFPNTYYAKERDPDLIRWTSRAWTWSRSYISDLWLQPWLAVWVLSLTGHRGLRLVVGASAFVVVTAVLELTDDRRLLVPVALGGLWLAYALVLQRLGDPERARWVRIAALVAAVGVLGAEALYLWDIGPSLALPGEAKTWPPRVLLAAAVGLPLLTIGQRHGAARATCWWICVAAAAFAVWSQGDWMKGYRWYAVTAVPGSIALAIGLEHLAGLARDHLDLSWRGTTLVVLTAGTLAFVPAQVAHTMARLDKLDARPQGVHKRVQYVEHIRKGLLHDGPWTALDVDMGGTLWWSDFVVHDLAGLVDVPLAHHRFARPFIEEYIFDEVRPHSAHVHLFWGTRSRLPTMARWRSGYVEIPPYPAGRDRQHGGNHIRRDLLFDTDWDRGIERAVFLGRGLHLEGFDVPSEAAAGRRMFIEVGVRSTVVHKLGQGAARLWMGLVDDAGNQAWFDLPLAYDWVPIDRWRRTEVFHGRFAPKLPADLPPGTYTAVFVAVDSDGRIITPPATQPLPPGALIADGETVPAHMARGEVQFADTVVILPVGEAGEAAVEDRAAALAAADAGNCEQAEHRWWLARMHRPLDHAWEDMHRPNVNRHLATCWARASQSATSLEDRVDALQRARRRDRTELTTVRLSTALAASLHEQGETARAAEDWELSYRRFSDAVDLDPSRSWSRRYAEEAREHRLGLGAEH